MDTARLQILIVDDHAIVRQGLREILREAATEAVVAEASDGLEALVQARAQAWDLIVLDINLPGLTGLDVLNHLRRDRPDQAAIMLSLHDARSLVTASLSRGARGYLTKESAPDELLEAIVVVLAGGIYLSRSLRVQGPSGQAGEHASPGKVTAAVRPKPSDQDPTSRD